MAQMPDLSEVSAEPLEMTPTRIANQQLNLDEYWDGAVRLHSRPLALFVELTQNCNLRCPMCRYGDKYRADWNMSEELYDRIAEELFPTALLVDMRGWGESTMLPHFAQFVAKATAHRVQLRLVTNGQSNRREAWDLMMRAHGMVTISCDAADPELYAKLREGGTIGRLERTVATIVAARDRYGAPRDNVHFNVVVSRDNLHDLVNIVALAGRLDVPRIVLNPLVTSFSDTSHLRYDLDATTAAYAAAAAAGRERGVTVQLGAAPDPSLAVPELVRQPPCIHPWSYAYVRYNGGVGFCDHMIGSDRFAIGSLADGSFEDIWNSEDWVELRRAHIANRIPDRFSPCRYSYAQRYTEFEHLVHEDRAAGIVSTETRDALTEWRDPALVPAVPWTPDMADDTFERASNGVLIPEEYLMRRVSADRPARR